MYIIIMCVCLKCFMDTKLLPVNCVTHVNCVALSTVLCVVFML